MQWMPRACYAVVCRMPRNWDEYYSDPANLDFAPAPLLVQVADMLAPGHCLDLACGAGRNALYLAALGWQVTAVDASRTAIRVLHEHSRGLSIDAIHADLEAGDFRIAPDAYDLICDFHYLQRDLFPQIRQGVRPGGAFAAAIHLLDSGPGAGPRNPAFLLRPEELRQEFAGWKILFYSEGRESADARAAARIIARRA